ncbi:MAG: condensation domain-containing protein [Actinocatenispora sp.]
MTTAAADREPGAPTVTGDAQQAAWLEAVDGLDPVDLPLDRPRCPSRVAERGRCDVALPEPVAERLAAVAKEWGVGTEDVLLAGVAVLVHRLAGTTDVPLAVPLGGPDTGDVAVVRVDLAGTRTFRQVVLRAAQARTDAADLGPVVLPPARRAELTRIAVGPPTQASDFDLCFHAEPGGVAVHHDARLLSAASAVVAGRHLTHLLAGALAPGRVALEDLSLLDPDTCGSLDGRAGSAAVGHCCVVDWVDVVAAQRGDEPAAGYTALRDASLRVRAGLRGRGVVAGDLVQIDVRPGVDRLAVLLGVLRCGATVRPADPGRSDVAGTPSWIVAPAADRDANPDTRVLVADELLAGQSAPDGNAPRGESCPHRARAGTGPAGSPVHAAVVEIRDDGLRRQPPMAWGELYVRCPGPPESAGAAPGDDLYATGVRAYRDHGGDVHLAVPAAMTAGPAPVDTAPVGTALVGTALANTAPADAAHEEPAQRKTGTDDPVTARLAEIWAEVLNVASVRPDDDFFLLGGYSLPMVQCAVRIRREFGVRMPLSALSQQPRLADFADWLRPSLTPTDAVSDGPGEAAPAEPDPSGAAELPPLRRRQRPDRIPLSHAQSRLWLVEQTAGYKQADGVSIGWLFPAGTGPDRLRAAVEALIARHEILRTTIQFDGDRPYQRVRAELEVPAHQADDLSATAVEHARTLLDLAYTTPNDIQHGPLVVMATGLCAEGTVLLINLHHVSVDGWSQEILSSELRTAFLDGALPATDGPQYADYALWERELLDERRLREGLAYWRTALSGFEPLSLRNTAQLPDGPVGSSLEIRLDPATVATLEAAGRTVGASLFVLLWSCATLALHAFTHRHDLVVGTDAANRIVPEIEPMVGFFVNQLALRARLHDEMSLRELLTQANTTVLDGLARQHIPFDQVVAAVNPPREANRTPLIGVKLVMQDVAEPPSRDASVRNLHSANRPGTDKHDAILSFERDGDGLVGFFEYAYVALSDASAARIADAFRAAVDGVAADPDLSVADWRTRTTMQLVRRSRRLPGRFGGGVPARSEHDG